MKKTSEVIMTALIFLALLAGCEGGSDTKAVPVPDANRAPIFLSSAPTIASISIQYVYNIFVADVESGTAGLVITISVSDTCGGILVDNGDGTGEYSFTPEPGQLGTQCDIGLVVSDGAASSEEVTTIDIVDTNSAPYFTSSAGTGATEGILYNYDITVADDNIPAQALTLSVATFDTCGGALADNGNGTGSYSFTPGELEGGIDCLIGLTVTDSMAASSDQYTKLTISEANQVPLINSSAPTSATVNVLYSYTADVSDDDIPAQTLNCSVSISDTCGGAFSGCTYTFTPTAPQGGTQCVVGITLSDGVDETEAQTTVDVAAAPCVVYVDDTAAGANDGTSWVDAYTNIQTGVDAGTASCDVWVAEGTYSTGTTTAVLTMQDGVSIYGGFAGTETSLSERVEPLSYPTVLDGQDVSYHVVIGGSDAALDGFYIINGNANGTYPESRGGGMYNEGTANLSINNCVFFGNSATLHGGGMVNTLFATPTITNSMFIGNSSQKNGGGMYNDFSPPTITNCTFSRNSAADWGGGMYNHYGAATITNSIFSENSADEGAGIMNREYSSLTVVNSVFTGNAARFFGGGIHNYSTPATITNCTFSGNSSLLNDGGAMYNNQSNPIISNTIMWGDTAVSGPEIFNNNSVPELSFSDINGCGGSGAWVAACGTDNGGNIQANPQFLAGLSGNYYLDQSSSPCVNAGTGIPSDFGLEDKTTSNLGIPDTGVVDMGFHYPIP